MPLNFQLTTRGGTLVQKTKTAASYKLFALKNTTPPKPGLQYHSKGQKSKWKSGIFRLPTLVRS
jgi:hypothetical protein